MAGDLERFLQEAAERLAQKVNQGQPQKKPVRPQPIRQAERARIDPDILDAEIIEADADPVPTLVPREKGPDPLSSLDTRPPLAQSIDQADERMTAHIHGALDHRVVNLRASSPALQRGGSMDDKRGSQVERRQRMVSPLMNMLRQPETLKAAFIASEIFKRKF